ncbi:hypothetical protein CSUI_007136 [Cystoisospora suis]|uniref:Uncharacterized protein n=1 Tax=Cystoisospora suis TaxID=483139 RepID=A0A2C6KNC0_9APIC|nr:hypothetical protein CSUI_007136 [Cystoisospora suis]
MNATGFLSDQTPLEKTLPTAPITSGSARPWSQAMGSRGCQCRTTSRSV